MAQLAINGTQYPLTSRDKYQANKVELGTSKRTIGGRLVSEIRGHFWSINYAYDYMGNALMRQLLTDIRSKQPLTVQFLPDEGDDPITGTFKCTKQPAPSVAFDRGGVMLWHNISFTLESIEAVI